MEVLPWYKSRIVLQQIASFIATALVLFKIKTDVDIEQTVLLIGAGFGALMSLFTLFYRLFKPAPNLTQTAVAKEIELVTAAKIPPSPIARPLNQQSGSFTVDFIVAILFCGACMLAGSALTGCVSTRDAYKAAPLHGEAIVDTAYVFAEHYDAVLEQAVALKQSGHALPTAITVIQEADRRAKPLILGNPDTTPATPGLRQFAATYTALHDAKSEADLQKAVNDAAIALSDLINAVNAAKGKK